MTRYSEQTKLLLAIDCIIFGFDGENIKLLIIKRGMAPEKNKWSLMGGFAGPREDTDQAATRILKQLTGMEGIYMEQLRAFSDPSRDPEERVISLVYYALIDLRQYKEQITEEYHPAWVPLKEIPELIFDHQQMVQEALRTLRYKAALHPVIFELLPDKFTLPQIQMLYSCVYDIEFDKRNFSRKLLSTGLLVKQKEKDRINSKKGAFFYKLDKSKYKDKFRSFLNFVPNADSFMM